VFSILAVGLGLVFAYARRGPEGVRFDLQILATALTPIIAIFLAVLAWHLAIRRLTPAHTMPDGGCVRHADAREDGNRAERFLASSSPQRVRVATGQLRRFEP
jgi:hypothetical protein